MSTKQEYIAEADRLLVQAGVPTYSELLAALKEARRAIGDHCAPHDCYATGPMTGDTIRDLVQCPACSAIDIYNDVMVTVSTK